MMLLLFVIFANGASCQQPAKNKMEAPPEVLQFVVECLEDREEKFMNVEKALLATDKKSPFRDQKLEVLSGLVWEIDRPRARALLKHIQSKKLKDRIEHQYKVLEEVRKPKAETI